MHFRDVVAADDVEAVAATRVSDSEVLIDLRTNQSESIFQQNEGNGDLLPHSGFDVPAVAGRLEKFRRKFKNFWNRFCCNGIAMIY